MVHCTKAQAAMVSKHQPRRIQFSIPDHSLNLHTRTEVMKPAHIFRDQVNTVAQWFDQWNDIEQTIACYSLLKRLGPTQARFLSLVLDYTFRDSAYEVQELEKEANCEDFLKGLCHESKEVAVQQLLLHLPLLHPGNDEARHEYLKLLPKILSHSLEYTIHEEECRQLLSLALVHPAFVPEERNSLTWWLGLLEDKGDRLKEHRGRPPPGFNTAAINMHSPLSATKSACEFYGKKSNQHASVTNTFSYKGLSTNRWKPQTQLTHTDSGIGNSFDNGPVGLSHPHKGTRDLLEDIFPRPNRSKSFPIDPDNLHSKVSPQSSIDSDEENSIQKFHNLTTKNTNPGMHDVPIWLKSLRLHKYAHIFEDITYEQMLGLSEEYLAKKEVTKGARKKIILCIQKIKERHSILQQLEKEVLQLGRLQHVLAELKVILMSPIKMPNKPKNRSTIDQNEEPSNTLQYTPDQGGRNSPPDNNAEPIDEENEEENSVKNDEEAEDSTDKVVAEEKCEKGEEQGEVGEEEEEEAEADGEDLPSEITRVMGKACTQILVTQPDEECCLTYLGLLDRVLSHDAFTPSHKRRLQSWKGQCQKLARQLATNRKLAGIEKGPKNWYDPLGSGIALGKRRPTSRTSSLKGSGSGSLLHIPLARAGPLVATQNMHKRVTLTNSYNNMNRNSHQSLSRTKSAPIRSNILLQPPHIGQQDADGINKSLETLCLSMTNHALEDTPEKSEVGFEE